MLNFCKIFLRNPGTKTIEEDLLAALLKAGYINEEVFNEPQLISFQRAARTDKGVSAIRQVLSLKLRKLFIQPKMYCHIIHFFTLGGIYSY